MVNFDCHGLMEFFFFFLIITATEIYRTLLNLETFCLVVGVSKGYKTFSICTMSASCKRKFPYL